MFRKLRIWRLQRKAGRYLRAYYEVLSSYSCGASIAEEVSPRAFRYKQKFNQIMDELSEIDPHCPKSRL